MSDLNVVAIGGRMAGDPELKYTPSQVAVCEFSVAVGGWDGKAETVSFVDVVAWKQTAEFVSKHLHKGDGVLVNGSLRQDRWEAKDGAKRSKIKINAFGVMFPPRGKKSDAGQFNGTGENVSPKPFGGDDGQMPF